MPMTRLTSACIAALVVSALAASATGQTVYPTGTTIYDPDRSWNGFTVPSPLGTQAVLGEFKVAAALGVGVVAQGAATRALPLDNLGLEHLDIIVPDPAASARFYARIFTSALHQQPVRDTLRYFVLLGDLPADRQVGYIAIGAAGGRAPAIGHYCTLARVYDRAGMASALQAAGYGVAAAGPTGMWPDPDRLELQLFQPPAGLVTAAVPSPLDVVRDGLLTPRGMDHVMLRVTSLEDRKSVV